MFDVLIRNASIIDGTGRARFSGELAVQGDRIAAVGDLAGRDAKLTLDAAGRILAPGFIDVHNHSDGWLLKLPCFEAKVSQGFTTEVLMADGISYAPVYEQTAPQWLYYLRALNGLTLADYSGWQSLDDYLLLLDGRSAQNAAVHIPFANVRTMACGFGNVRPDDYQMNLIKAAVREGMAAGAVGLSTGLDYISQCFADTDELVAAASAMAAARGLYVTHVRYKKGVVAGVNEAIEIGRRAGVRVHISHLKGTTPSDMEAVLKLIDSSAADEVDLSFDVYPYLPGSTMLSYLLPYEVWIDGPLAVLDKLRRRDVRDKFALSLRTAGLERAHIAWVAGKENSRHQGQNVAEYVKETGRPAADALCDLLIEERLAVLMVVAQELGDDMIEPFLRHPRFMLGSDGIWHAGATVHPRVYGSATRILGPLVRDKRLFTLEEAVARMTSIPAKRFGLTDRGVLQAGAFADLVVFDAETIADRATYRDPERLSTGVEHVFVNGQSVWQGGKPSETKAAARPGRALRARH